ncbi:MAG: hypothetical protein IPM94_12840 [bacterium]|nr:hypothetical protein [bacterium]
MSALLQRLNPAVPRRALPLVAGALWGLVALMLLTRAAIWLLGSRPVPGAAAAAVGVLMAAVLIPRAFGPWSPRTWCAWPAAPTPPACSRPSPGAAGPWSP